MSSLSTKIAVAINGLLAKTGFQIVRSSSLDRLIDIEAKYSAFVTVAPNPPLAVSSVSNEDVERRLAALEARNDDQSIRNVISYAMKAHWRAVDLIERVSGDSHPTLCALCGYTADKEAFAAITAECRFFGGRLLRHRCPNCEVVFGPQKMLAIDDQMLDLEYKNIYRIYSEGNSTESVIRTFQLLEPKRDGTYLDFGCGGEWSEAIQRLRSEGWNIYGFEPSASNGSDFVFSRWDQVEQFKFEGILSHNVLEHLFDPISVTRRLRDLLTPSGRIVHATACFEYIYEYSHYHVFFFTGRSPEILADRSGMKIVDWVRDGEYVACLMESI